MYVPAFYLKQRFAMTANRFEVVVANPDGSEGASLAWAQQKRLAFKEQVTFYADQARTQPVFGFRARQVVDLGAGYDVVDGAGRPLGYFKKDFGASLLRSTFHVEGPGLRGTGTERSKGGALMRRFVAGVVPIHFDFTADDGRMLFTVERQMKLRDRYTVSVLDPEVDFRLAAGIAVGLDVLMDR
ncbi:MAG: hypothetical protein CMH83_11410 [Nocardioides sp.]|nr:hypothetical protein [Nocardioides sp.]